MDLPDADQPYPTAGPGDPGGPGDLGGDIPYTDRFVLPAHAGSVFLARVRARRLLQKWGVEEGLGDNVVLVISELSTNAITHGSKSREPGVDPHFQVGLSLNSRLRVEVSDGDPTAEPTLIRPGPRDDYGRGLLLVEKLTARWGTLLSPPWGKTVWAEFVLPGPPPPFPQEG